MFSIFKRRDESIVQLLSKLEEADRAVPTELKVVSIPLFAQFAKLIKTRWTKQNIDDYKTQIKAGESHEAFIYNFVIHAVGDKLESGHLHTYRGALGIQGRLYKQLFEHAINTMVSTGAYTNEWADKNLRAAVYKGIKEVG